MGWRDGGSAQFIDQSATAKLGGFHLHIAALCLFVSEGLGTLVLSDLVLHSGTYGHCTFVSFPQEGLAHLSFCPSSLIPPLPPSVLLSLPEMLSLSCVWWRLLWSDTGVWSAFVFAR